VHFFHQKKLHKQNYVGYISQLWLTPGTSFHCFPRGGGTFDRLFGGGKIWRKKIIVCAKTHKSRYFSNSGGKGNATPAPPQ